MEYETAQAIPQSIGDVFLAQGLIGAVALIALLVAAFLYQRREKDAEKFTAITSAMQTKHESLIAAKDAMIQKIQEDRIIEMKASMIELGKAMQTVEQVTNGFESALSLFNKRGR